MLFSITFIYLFFLGQMFFSITIHKLLVLILGELNLTSLDQSGPARSNFQDTAKFRPRNWNWFWWMERDVVCCRFQTRFLMRLRLGLLFTFSIPSQLKWGNLQGSKNSQPRKSHNAPYHLTSASASKLTLGIALPTLVFDFSVENKAREDCRDVPGKSIT